MWSRRRDRWSRAACITVMVTVVAVQCVGVVAAGGNADAVQLHNEMPIDVEAFEEQADAELLEFVGLSLNETMEMSDVSAQGWSRGRYAESFKIPSKYSSIQRYCSHLNRVKDSTLSTMYERAVPLTGNMPHGCNPGCLIGTSYGATMNRGPSGGDNAEWVGKCFYPASGRVKNQITANPWYTFGAIEPVMIEAFEAKVYVGESWYNKTENAIIIDYDDTPRQYGRSFQCYRDEMRYDDDNNDDKT